MGAEKVPPPPDSLFVSEQPPSPQAKRLEAARESMARFVASAPPPRRESKSGVSRIREEMREMNKAGDWERASGGHFVALYEALHLTVYGVEASELGAVKEWQQASAAAGRMLAAQFGDDPVRMLAFVRWTWKREQKTEAWRRENGRSGRRVGWRLQFGNSLVTDYRLDEARTAKAPR